MAGDCRVKSKAMIADRVGGAMTDFSEHLPQYSVSWLRKQRQMQFLFFWGHRRFNPGCLSQWWPEPFVETRVGHDGAACTQGQRYCCMEQYMMAAKARLFQDETALALIMQEQEPGRIKAAGRKIQNFKQDVWDRYKYSIVFEGNLLKFGQNPDLKSFLLSTGSAILVEASPMDFIWGIGLAATDAAAREPAKWPGTNLLGFALMEVRDRLRLS